MIKISNLSKIYSSSSNIVKSLDNINLEIENFDFVSIIGSSGSGKTTLMNILGTLDIQTDGNYYLNGNLINSLSQNEISNIRNEQIGFIFQSFNLLPKLTALENVELPLMFKGIPKNKRRVLSELALEKVGLLNRMSHKPSEMSGGQQQRVAIARAIALSPPIILADEPTGNLDPQSTKDILEILTNLHLDGRLVILITHDEHIANSAKRVISLNQGKIVSDIRRF